MVMSMTGYGRAQSRYEDGQELTVELKSVNSRYLEYSVRVPRSMMFLEDAFKSVVAQRVQRGKVELTLTVADSGAYSKMPVINIPVAQAYYQAACEASEKLGLINDLTLRDLVCLPEVLTLCPGVQNEQQLVQRVCETAQRAVCALVEMRRTEGERMAQDMTRRLVCLQELTEQAQAVSSQRMQAYTERLYARLSTVLQDQGIDEARMLTEAAVFADRTAVDEEAVRLQSHCKQFDEILSEGGPIGRRLDFLTQEMNREANTIGSKCSDLAMTRMVVDMKSEIEKIREQVQNIE